MKPFIRLSWILSFLLSSSFGSPANDTFVAPAIQQPRIRPDGTFQFQLFANPGETKTIQTSTDLGQWTTMATFVVTNVPMEISDTNARSFAARFYRVIGDSPSDDARKDDSGSGTVPRPNVSFETTVGLQANAQCLVETAGGVRSPALPTNSSLPRIQTNGAGIGLYERRGLRLIRDKLNSIFLPKFGADHQPLGEVIKLLADESRKIDPRHHGVNFIVNRQSQFVSRSITAIDPTTGLPISDVASVEINLHAPLMNVRLADVLDAIVKCADEPIQYSIEDYAVVFSLKETKAEPLFTRRLKVDLETFLNGLESVMGEDLSAYRRHLQPSSEPIKTQTHTNTFSTLHFAVHEFFVEMGVDLWPPKSIFLNGDGSLLVHATMADINLLEAAIQVLNAEPPRVKIRVEILEDLNEANRTIGEVLQDASAKRNGARVIHESTIEMVSGRHEHVEIAGIASSIALQNGSAKDAQSDDLRDKENNAKLTLQKLDAALASAGTGTALGLLAYVSPERQIQLTVIAESREVSGFDEPSRHPLSGVYDYVAPMGGGSISLDRQMSFSLPPNFVRSANSGVSIASGAQVPMPHLRIRQFSTSTNVMAGQTVTLALSGIELGSGKTAVARYVSLTPFLEP